MANHGKDWLVQSWLVSNPNSVPGIKLKSEAFQKITIDGLKGALELGQRGLSGKLDSGIENLQAQHDKLD